MSRSHQKKVQSSKFHDEEEKPRQEIITKKMITLLSKKRNTSVGYELKMTHEQWNRIQSVIKTHLPDVDFEMSGMMYGEMFYGSSKDIGEVHGDPQVSQQQLKDWFAKKLGTQRVGYLSNIIFSKTVVLGFVEFNTEKFYVILANSSHDTRTIPKCPGHLGILGSRLGSKRDPTHSIRRMLETNPRSIRIAIDKIGIEIVPHKIESMIKMGRFI